MRWLMRLLGHDDEDRRATKAAEAAEETHQAAREAHAASQTYWTAKERQQRVRAGMVKSQVKVQRGGR